jgi:hypothetical protein
MLKYKHKIRKISDSYTSGSLSSSNTNHMHAFPVGVFMILVRMHGVYVRVCVCANNKANNNINKQHQQ